MRVLNEKPAPLRSDGVLRHSADLVEAAAELPEREARRRLERGAGALHHVDPFAIRGDDARTAFWINIYNALRLHVFEVDPPVVSVAKSLSRFRSYAWRIGGHDYTLSIIHHGLLRGNRRPHWTWGPLLGEGDPRLQAAPGLFDPRIHFALAFGAQSSPLLRGAFDADRIDAQLRDAERDYVLAHTRMHEKPVIFLEVPPMLRAYRADFGVETKLDALDWLARRLPDEKRIWLEERRSVVQIPWKLLVFGWAFSAPWKKSR